MGGETQKVEESGLSNPAMKAAATTIGNQLNTQLSAGVRPFDQSMVPGLSGQTSQGIGSIMSAAGNTGGLNAANNWATGTMNSGGYNPALSGAQSGVNQFLQESQADAPGYAAMRAKVADDAGVMANATFTNSGRFGADSHREALGEGIGTALAGMDMQNYESRLGRMLGGNQALAGIGQTAMGNAAGAAGMAPGLMQAGFIPGQMQMQAGQTMDAYNSAVAQDNARRFDATQNAGWNTLQRGLSIFAGTAPVSGTTSTQTTTQPWWVAPTAIAGTLGSAFL